MMALGRYAFALSALILGSALVMPKSSTAQRMAPDVKHFTEKECKWLHSQFLSECIDTENAVIRATITREDAVAYCNIQGGRATGGCLSELARYARTLKSEIRANCTTKQFTDFFGNRYAFLGANPERDKDDGESHARYILKELGTGEISNGTNSTGYFKNSALFSALCPRSAPKDW
jgi:hypothetical protein